LMTGIIVLHVLESTLYAAGYWIGLTYQSGFYQWLGQKRCPAGSGP